MEAKQSEFRTPTSDNFCGCLIGCCLGDSLGFLVEGTSAKESAKLAKEIKVSVKEGKLTKTLLKRAQDKGINFGQYSDDSQTSRELIQSILENGDFIPQQFATRIALLVKEGRIVGCGMATAKAAAKLNKGVNWDESGSKIGEAGNGTAIRASPIGLFYFDNIEKIAKFSIEQSIITHKDPRCAVGAFVIAVSVSLCVQLTKIDTNEFIDKIVTILRDAVSFDEKVRMEVADYILNLKSLLKISPNKVVKTVGKLGQDFDDGSTGISGFVTSSVIWSLYCFLRTPTDPVETLLTAIRSGGGDTDSTSAMAGSLSGAFLGLKALPHLSQFVNDKGTWKFEELVQLSENLFKIKSK